MSRCDITIDFDRPDRKYHGGETVSGEVHVRVNKDTTSDGIVLENMWTTHGYGNSDGRGLELQELAKRTQLKAGQKMSFPFSFTAARQPITYHGHHINIDHYVTAHIDVPWALDPKVTEDYLLLPGKPPPEMPDKRDELIDFTPESSSKFHGCLMALLYAVIVSIAIPFAPIILPVLGVIWIRKKMVARRLGGIELTTPHLLVAPGEDWPLELKFTPKKSFRINGIQAEILGREAATAGSGTNKTTKTHKVHDEVYELESEGQISAGESFDRKYTVPFPETDAYSLAEEDNKITWTVKVRIDIPWFPDWTSKPTVQVLPAKFFENAAVEQPAAAEPDPALSEAPADNAAGEQPVPPAIAPDPVAATPEPVAPEAPPEIAANEQPTAPNAEPAPDEAPSPPSSMQTLVEELSAAGGMGNERNEIIRSWSSRELDVIVEIDRTSSTFDSDADERYRNGWTITGTVADTEQAIEVLVPEGRSVDDLSRGDRWPARIVVSKWDSLYNRISALEVAPI
tara:strand:+ start:817 stop:2355 length:1539 start_codon:yes stop_codon:yes gene_type:complete